MANNLPSCELNKVRDQFNALTHWLDASNVYGSTVKEARDVRDGDSIFLKTFDPSGSSRRSLLPLCREQKSKVHSCNGHSIKVNRVSNCKVGGDTGFTG